MLPRLRRDRALAWLALVLLLVNAVSPAIAESLSTPAGEAGGLQASLLDDPFDGRIVICTPTGLRVITMGPDGTAPEDSGEAAREGLCPFSPPLSGSTGAALPLLAGLLPPPPPAPPVLAPARTVETAPRPCSLILVRAPRGPPSVA